MILLRNLFLCLCSCSALCAAAPSAMGGFAPSEADWAFAEERLASMAVDDKVGQLIQVGYNARFMNQESAAFRELARHVEENKIGSLLFFAGPVYETVHLANRMQALADVPLLVALDAETGVGMRFAEAENFPWAMAVAATGNPDYARAMGEVTGREARVLGIHQVYAPVLDVNNNADNPVINVRSFGEDPGDVARFGVAFIEGVQSQEVIATAKHFPGHGDTNVDSHRGLPIIDVSPERLREVELAPFAAAIEAGVASIMMGHISLPQVDPVEIQPIQNALRVDAEEGAEIVSGSATRPATLSPVFQTEMLRGEFGFDGLIVTDSMGMSGLTLYVDQAEAGVRAFLAGTDILVKPADIDAMIGGLREAVASGRIGADRLDASVLRILAWKHALGLFDQKISPLDPIDQVVASKETRALAEAIANDAMTLVRYDADLLPLTTNQRVFVLALSNGSEGDAAIRPLTAFLAEQGVAVESRVIQYDSPADQIVSARRLAGDADVVIAALCGRVRSGARNSVGLPQPGIDLLRDLIANDAEVIGLSFGNPYLLQAFPELRTYVVAYGGMATLQRAAGRALYGIIPFQGRLPISLPGLYPRGTGLLLED